MKPLIVHPGAHWSTHDCFVALVEALRDAGQPLAEYRLDGRLARAHDFINIVRDRMREEQQSDVPTDTSVDEITWLASTGLVERALLTRCDAIWIVTGNLVRPELIEIARRIGLQVSVWLTETPYVDWELDLAARVDACWTNERASLGAFQAACSHVAYLRHAWRRGLHDVQMGSVDAKLPRHDVVFVGTYFPERLALLEAVDWTGIDLGLYGMTDQIPALSPLRPFVRAELTANDVTVALYRRAKVGLNLFRAPHVGQRAESLNPRAYELAAAGVCAVSEYRAEVPDVFGDAVPTFRVAAELESHLRRLLLSAGERRERGRVAQMAVARDSWRERARDMVADAERWAA